MPNVIIAPASNSPYPPFTVSIQAGEGELVEGMRKRVAERYYVETSQVLLIYKGKVLSDEMSLEEIGIKENARVNVSINCPTRQTKNQQRKGQIQEEIEDFPLPTPVFESRSSKTPQTPSAVSKSSISNKPSHTHSPSHSHALHCNCPLHANQEEFEETLQSAVSKLMSGGGSGHSSVFESVLNKMMGKLYNIPPLPELRVKFSKQMAQLKDMGVCTAENEELCLRELFLNKGDVSGAVYYITRDVIV